jgi:putative ABC transport system permease protein
LPPFKLYSAFSIASPAFSSALKDSPYSGRVNITWWVFGQAGAAAVFIAFATISFQAIKAAIANPVKNLKAE